MLDSQRINPSPPGPINLQATLLAPQSEEAENHPWPATEPEVCFDINHLRGYPKNEGFPQRNLTRKMMIKMYIKNYPGKRPQTVGGGKEARLVVVMMMTMTHR